MTSEKIPVTHRTTFTKKRTQVDEWIMPDGKILKRSEGPITIAFIKQVHWMTEEELEQLK